MNTLIATFYYLAGWLLCLGVIAACFRGAYRAEKNAIKIGGFILSCVLAPIIFSSAPDKDYISRTAAAANAADAIKEAQVLIASEDQKMQKLCSTTEYTCIKLTAGQNRIDNVGKGSKIILSKANCSHIEQVVNEGVISTCKIIGEKTKSDGSILINVKSSIGNTQPTIAISAPSTGGNWWLGVAAIVGIIAIGLVLNANEIDLLNVTIALVAVCVIGGLLYLLFTNWDLIIGTIGYALAMLLLACAVVFFIYTKFFRGADSGYEEYGSGGSSGASPSAPARRYRKPKPRDTVTSKGVLINFKSGKSVFRRFRK